MLPMATVNVAILQNNQKRLSNILHNEFSPGNAAAAGEEKRSVGGGGGNLSGLLGAAQLCTLCGRVVRSKRIEYACRGLVKRLYQGGGLNSWKKREKL